MLNAKPVSAGPTIGLYFVSGARKSYNLAKTLSLSGCRVFVRMEPSLAELLDPKHKIYVDTQYCAWIYQDPGIEIIPHVSAAPPVDAMLYELCRDAPRYPDELRAWVRQAPKVAAWNSSWHEGSLRGNLRSELDIVKNFLEFLPRTRSVVMHNGRTHLRPTAMFSRHAYIQGAFVHPRFLYDDPYRVQMFETPWRPETQRGARLIFAGDAISPRRRPLLERTRPFVEQWPDIEIILNYRDDLDTIAAPKSDKKLVLWLATYDDGLNQVPIIKWPAVLRNCDFCFCPPGYEQKSHRVFECLLQGSIPILHCPYDYDIGMRDGVDCIIVKNGDWKTGIKRAMECSPDEIVRLRRGVAVLAERHLRHRGSAQRWLNFMGVKMPLPTEQGGAALARAVG